MDDPDWIGGGGLTTHLALLRGINVGGANKVPMKELRELSEGLGLENVSTYLQSGNLIFETSSSRPNQLTTAIEEAIQESFGLQISVILRTQRELARVASGNPFLTASSSPTSLHVAFLADRAAPRAVKTLDPSRSPPDEFEVKGREVYLWFPNGSGRSKLTIDYFEKKLGTRATARNWNTVTKVLDLMTGS